MSFDVLGSVVAAIVSMVFGFLWYSNALFGARWRMEMGWSNEMMEAQKQKGMAKEISLGLIGEFITALVVSYFIYTLGITSVADALTIAFWGWLGFSATLQFGEVLWAKHSMTLFFINTSHRLVSLALIALIIVLI